MKKVLLIAAVAAFAMTSCKKDYTCECTTTTNAPISVGPVSGKTGKMKKKDAESKCNEGDMTWSTQGIDANFNPVTWNYTTECAIK
jgi:hypothetical protein